MAEGGLDGIISAATERFEAAEASGASEAVSDSGGGEAEAATPGAGAETAVAATVAETQDSAATPAEPDVPDLTEAELSAPQIPVHRHKAVLTKARKEAEALKKKIEELAWAERPDTREKIRAIEIAESNPDLFLQVLAQDPRYATVLQRMYGGNSAEREKPAAATQQPPNAVSERPQPDVLLPDGNVGFSAPQQEKYIQWALQQQEDLISKRLEEKFGKLSADVKPVVETYQQQVIYNQALERQKVVVSEARETWPGFKEAEGEIKSYLMRPENLSKSLEQGYRAVVIPRMQSDRERIRKEVMAELAKAPKAAHPGPTSVAAPAGKETLEQRIARASGLTLSGE